MAHSVPQIDVIKSKTHWAVICSACGTVARREFDLDAETFARRHRDSHLPMRRG